MIKKNKEEQVSILSKSRFSVLSTYEEEGEIPETKDDMEEENKVEDEDMEDDKDLEMEESVYKNEEDIINTRQYLPRGSKNKHKFLSVTVQRARGDGPGDQNKKKKYRKAQ